MSSQLACFIDLGLPLLRLLLYDGDGFWLCLRRFSSGKLLW